MKNLNQLEWLKKQIQKDEVELIREKYEFVENIKKYKPEDLVKQPKTKEIKKMTIWQRLMKVLMG